MSQQVSAQALFADCTYLGSDPEVKKAVSKQCLQQGYIPIIEYDEQLGWVFHSLQYPPHDMVWKKAIAAQFETKKQEEGCFLSEAEIETALCQTLMSLDIFCLRQVTCPTGRIDVVTRRSIIEIKQVLDRGTFFGAIGQVLSYRTTFFRTRQPVILTLRLDDDVAEVARSCSRLGITIVVWDGVSPELVSEL